ncbi:MAG: tRNA pseudouridine(38-40) synthase TruA [Vulcanisaeta sp.]|nr:tRNA pseudouridine(38-40) synthase TruA [Vulcanisaeta sp.]
MTVVALKLFYDGTLFNGFSGGVGSVEYYVRRAVGKFVSNYVLSKASRTDPGVSAVGNVVSIKFSGTHKLLPSMINSELPEGVRAWAWAVVDEDFRARAAVARTYVYVMPWLHEDVDLMREAARLFVGEHDLVNFQVRDKGVPTTVKIYDVEVDRYGNYVMFVIKGKGFRNKMIRKIVNSIRMVGLGMLSMDELRSLINAEVRRPIPPAPPYGLLLLNVEYGAREPNWVVDLSGVSYILNYLNDRFYKMLSINHVISRILQEFMDIDKLFSRI